MSNEQERLAREWAVVITTVPNIHSELAQAAAEYILAHTAPPTMDEVEWDWEKHYLAGATFVYGQQPTDVVMIGPTRKGGIYCAVLEHESLTSVRLWPVELTPNGKKYELVEVTDKPENPDKPTQATVSSNENVRADQPEHPATLTTEQDYEDAPEGTVVAKPGCLAWTKSYGGDWDDEGGGKASHEMAGTEREVLRWRWVK